MCLLAVGMLSACSVKRMAVDLVAGSMSGGDSFATEEDPQLVYEAIPFAIKMSESMLEVSPRNRELLLATAKGFAGYAFLTRDRADRMDNRQFRAARRERARASRLFLRARDYALRALELDHSGIGKRLQSEGPKALAATDKDDIDALYWAGASWAGAVSAGKRNLELVAQLPFAAALVKRVLELDETYDAGAAHEFMVAYEAGRPGGSLKLARRHYRRALELSGAARASVHLALAENVSVARQDLREFRSLLAAAQRIDLDRHPKLRLVNTVAQRRARWLERRIPQLFLTSRNRENPK